METFWKMKKKFCPYCGTRLDSDSKFCKKCGHAVEQEDEVRSFPDNDGNGQTAYGEDQRQAVYEGRVYKCPQCGEVMNSFVANCPSCGFELRGTNTVKKFSKELAALRAKEMPESERKSLLKTIFGSDLKDDEEAKEEFEEQKKQEIESFIRNFSIPNTKEDICEFAILAMSNIKSEDDNTDIWFAKLEQAKQKALIMYDDSYEYKQINRLYQEVCEKRREKEKLKVCKVIGLSVLFVIGILMMIAGYYSGDEDSIFYLIGLGFIVAGVWIPIVNSNKKDKK